MGAKASNLRYILGPWMRSGQVQVYSTAAKKGAWITETRPLTRLSPCWI
jgi:hypothetical protein